MQQRDIADIAYQLGVLVRVRKHQKLHDKFDVDHAATVVLYVEQSGRIRVTVEHARAHLQHIGAEFLLIAPLHQNQGPFGLEAFADLRVARRIACPRERLMLPWPCSKSILVALVARERVERRDQQAGVAIGPQPQIDLEQLAGRCVCRQPRHQSAREQQIHLGCRRVFIVIQENQIEVGFITELFAAELAVTDHSETRHIAVPPGSERHAYSIARVSVASANADKWSASRSTVSRPSRSATSSRNTCA